MGQEIIDGSNDPYIMLAYYIVSHYSLPAIRRALTDDEWIRGRVQEDCMELDLAGPFLDAVMHDIDQHNRLWLRGRLKELGAAMFTMLDLKRLRKHILQIIVLS